MSTLIVVISNNVDNVLQSGHMTIYISMRSLLIGGRAH